MSWIDDLSLGRKLNLAPAACLLLLGLSAGGALWGFAEQGHALESLYRERLPSYALSVHMESGLRDMNALINRSLGYEAMGYNASEVAGIDRELAKTTDELKGALDAHLASSAIQEQERRELTTIAVAFAKYDKAVKETLSMKPSGAAIASIYLTTAQKEYEAALKEVNLASQAKLDQAGSDVSKAVHTAARAQWAIALALGSALGIVLSRSLTRRIRSLSSSVSLLAAGDLSHPVRAQGRDEIGMLMTDLERVRQQLTTSMRSVQQASESVRLAAGEIASGNADLSHRTEQQASNVQSTAASMQR